MPKKQDMPNSIEVRNISKDFILPHEQVGSVKQMFTNIFRRAKGHGKETQHVLHNVSFTIKQGEFVGIVGRNGSGKSTLLKMLAQIYRPTKGDISVHGKLVPFIELGVGFNPELTGRENVYLNGALMGFSTKEVHGMYDDIVSFAELERFMDQKLKNYSSGMQVRLAFSVAIIAQADILLIDEVLAVGDADFQRKCFEYFKSLKKQKKTVILVTHDMSAVRGYCDRAILINKGEVVADSGAEVVAEQYMRLFVDEEQVTEASKQGPTDAKRWGDGTVKVEKVETDKSGYQLKDKEITVRMRVKAHVATESPVFGFSIKDAADNTLFGTNSRIKGLEIPDLAAGDEYEVEWVVPNILSDGKHFVNATVEHGDGVSVCDWWNEAATIMSFNPERTAYQVAPPITVTAKKL